MWKLLLKRLALFPLVLAVIYTGTFLLMMAAPGDPLVGELSKVPAEVLAEQRKLYNLDGPWYQQYWQYVRQAAVSTAHGRLQLGYSIYYKGKPVAEVIGLTPETWSGGAMATSLTLGLLSLALAVLVGVHVGTWSAVRQNRLADHAALAACVVGISLPSFIVGALLIWLLGVALPVFPIGDWGTLRGMVLPAVTLSLPYMAYVARLMRAGMLDVLEEDYIRTARAKGLSQRVVVHKHAFKLAFLPVLSFLGPAAAAILTGSFVVEQLFAIPGIGQHFTLSVLNRDQPMILGTVLVYAVLLVSFNLLVDVAYLFVDPRIREAKP